MKIHQSHGLSLTELLIASAIIGIIMTGIAVFTISVRQMQVSSQTTMYTNMKLAALMKAIRTDAELMIGDPVNTGIQSNVAGSTRSICFRQDLTNTPDNYSDDTWVCWYHHNSSPGIRRCFNINPANVPPTSTAMCSSAAETRDYFELADINFFSFVTDPDGRFKYLTLSLTAHDTNKPYDALKNPNISLVTHISPHMMAR
ncbi:MAG: PilW family protein [Candidatus Omnitrophota bacterium]